MNEMRTWIYRRDITRFRPIYPFISVLSSAHQKSCSKYQKQPPEVFSKKDVLRNSQNSHENTCARVSFLFCSNNHWRIQNITKPIIFWWLQGAVVQRCSVKKVFLKISQNSQENTCARVSFLKKRPWHKRFLVNFTKFLGAPIFIEHLWWMLLDFRERDRGGCRNKFELKLKSVRFAFNIFKLTNVMRWLKIWWDFHFGTNISKFRF